MSGILWLVPRNMWLVLEACEWFLKSLQLGHGSLREMCSSMSATCVHGIVRIVSERLRLVPECLLAVPGSLRERSSWKSESSSWKSESSLELYESDLRKVRQSIMQWLPMPMLSHCITGTNISNVISMPTWYSAQCEVWMDRGPIRGQHLCSAIGYAFPGLNVP